MTNSLICGSERKGGSFYRPVLIIQVVLNLLNFFFPFLLDVRWVSVAAARVNLTLMASGGGGGGDFFSTGTIVNYFCEAFPFKHFLSRVTQMQFYHANKRKKEPKKQLSSLSWQTKISSYASVRPPFQCNNNHFRLIDWQISGFGKYQRENQEDGGPFQLYIYFYIYLN